jgi:peptide chain release factor subunit 1
MSEITQKEKYNLKRQIEELKSCKGKHTELISLYIPLSKQIHDVNSYLKNELSQSQNIKSKTTRKNVLSAIESIMSRLKYFKQTPEKGLIFFIGHKSTNSDQTEMVSYIIEPPIPIVTFLYRCDSMFYTEPLENMLVEKDIYGLLLIDRRECTIGMLKGNRIELHKYMTSQVPGKHGKGGQSQRRFERLTEIAAHEWFVKCGEKASEIFSTEENIEGILIGGSGPSKQYFVDEDYLHYEIQDKIIDTFDTGYTDEYGLKELVNVASRTMSNLKIAKEKKTMNIFLKEVTKTGENLAIYGEKEVRKALKIGAIDTLLLSEDLRNFRVKFRCEVCKNNMEITIDADMFKDFNQPNCPKCKTDNTMDLEDKIDLIDDLTNLALKTGANIELISKETEEGDSLFYAFSGIAGILRFPLDIS